jgi:16S rRNA processing protein RimM
VATNPPPLFAVGRVARAHGVRGKVLIAPFNTESAGLEHAKALWLGPRGKSAEAKSYTVTHAERVNLGYIFTLRGVDSRDASEALRGREVSVDRSELPELDEGEVWAADLVGCQAFDAAGVLHGEVVGLEQAGPNELLQIKLVAGQTVLFPLSLVTEADPEGKRAVITVPDGLFEAQLAPLSAQERAEAARAELEEQGVHHDAEAANQPSSKSTELKN